MTVCDGSVVSGGTEAEALAASGAETLDCFTSGSPPDGGAALGDGGLADALSVAALPSSLVEGGGGVGVSVSPKLSTWRMTQ